MSTSDRTVIAEICRDDDAFLGIDRDGGALFLSRSPRNTPSEVVREWIETGFQMPWEEALAVSGTHVINWVRECAAQAQKQRRRARV